MINIGISLTVWFCIVIAWAFFVAFVLRVNAGVAFVLGMPMGLLALVVATVVYDCLESRRSYRQ